jgi:hypothetical protein
MRKIKAVFKQRRVPNVEFCLLARKSKVRSGTRYSGRGIDDAGRVAGFVETELLVRVDHGPFCSQVQVRGSVPVFWEQNNALSITMTRDEKWNSLAFAKHHKDLVSTYGDNVVYFSLLSNSKKMEKELNDAYEIQVKESGSSLLSFDFHAHIKHKEIVFEGSIQVTTKKSDS